jgi:activating signal cointegrator 1
MKVLTLTQPWATLVAIGAKTIETRSWRTSYEGPIAIHAARGFPRACESLCHRDPFVMALINAGFNKAADLPRGMIVAVAELVFCVGVEAIEERWQYGGHFARTFPEDRERAFGDFSEGRYGWILESIRPLREPIPYLGALGLRTLSADVEAAVRQQLRSVA